MNNLVENLAKQQRENLLKRRKDEYDAQNKRRENANKAAYKEIERKEYVLRQHELTNIRLSDLQEASKPIDVEVLNDVHKNVIQASKKRKYEEQRREELTKNWDQYRKDIERRVEDYFARQVINLFSEKLKPINLRPKTNDLMKPERGKSKFEDIFPFVSKKAEEKANEEKFINERYLEAPIQPDDKPYIAIDPKKDEYNEARWQEARNLEAQRLEEEEVLRLSKSTPIFYPIGTNIPTITEISEKTLKSLKLPISKDVEAVGPLQHVVSSESRFNLPSINIIDENKHPKTLPKTKHLTISGELQNHKIPMPDLNVPLTIIDENNHPKTLPKSKHLTISGELQNHDILLPKVPLTIIDENMHPKTLPTSSWDKTLQLPEKILNENLNLQNDSKKNSDSMAHLLAGAALGSLFSQATALPNDQKHYTQAEKDANTHPNQGSNDVDDFLYTARYLGKNGFAKALKLLGQSKSEAELKEILNVAKGVLEQSKGKAGLISMIDTTLNNRSTMSPRVSIKQHIAEITSRVKLNASDEIMMADKRLDDTDLKSLTATGIRKVEVGKISNSYTQDEYGYDEAGKEDSVNPQKRKFPTSVPSSPSPSSPSPQPKKVKLVDDVTNTTQNATQNTTQKLDPEGGPAAGNAADPTMPKASSQWTVPNVPVSRPDEMVYFKRGKSSGAEMFGLNSFIGAEQMKKSEFLNLFPQYATQDMVRGTRFREDANNMEIQKENIQPKFVDKDKKIYLKIDENGIPIKYGESPITFPLQEADMKRFAKSIPVDPRIQYDTTEGYSISLNHARKIIPNLDFSKYEVNEPETVIPVPNVGQPLPLPVAPDANIFDSMNINAAKLPDYDPYRQAASSAWNGVLNTGQILAASYIGATMGPVGGMLFNHALNGMMSSLSKYDPAIGFTRQSQGQSGQNPDSSQVVHDLRKHFVKQAQKEETSEKVLEQAPQILNPLTVQAENQRVGTLVVDAFSKGQVARSQVSQTAKGFLAFYKDSTSPFAIDLPLKDAPKPEKPLP